MANNGEFQGIGGTEAETTALVAAGMPLAVAVETANLEYLGTAADDAAPGQQVAWYARREAAHATRLLKIAQGGSGVAAVTLTDYAAGTVMAGSYHPQSYLFQTAPPVAGATTASLPAPFYSADTEHNYTRLLLARPDPSLPPSFVVRGKSWWYAGADAAGNALYQGFYNNQLMTLGAADGQGQRLVTLSDPSHNNGTATSGTLSSERKSVRLRDGTLVLSGTEQGTQALVQHVDQHKLHTIAADLDLLGNNLSFGILQGDASLAGALFQFSDQGGTASLHSTLSRPQAQWVWSRAADTSATLPPLPPLPVMKLDASNKLKLYDPAGGVQPGVVLDPAINGVSTIRGVLRVRPGGDISMGEFTAGGEP